MGRQATLPKAMSGIPAFTPPEDGVPDWATQLGLLQAPKVQHVERDEAAPGQDVNVLATLTDAATLLAMHAQRSESLVRLACSSHWHRCCEFAAYL